jgi:hypothetical protein
MIRSTTLIRILLLAIVAIAFTRETTNAQCLPGWQYRVPVSITNTGSSVTDYLALVTLNTQTLISSGKMRADGGDIRAYNASCTSLGFFVESGLNTTTTRIWAKVPTLANGTTTIYIYYGNAGATRTNQASDAFGSGIVSLFTFTEGSGSTLHDWAGGFDLTLTSLTWGSGFRSNVGSLTGFTGGGRATRSDQGPALGAGSFSALVFINPTNVSGSTQGIVGNYVDDATNGWDLKLQGGTNFMFLTNVPGTFCQQGGGNVTTNSWQMIGGTRNSGVDKRLFQDGANVLTHCAGDNRNVSNNGPYEVGRSYNGQYPFNGSISLVAVYNTPLTDAQMQALTTSIRPSVEPTMSFGAEQTAPTLAVTLTPNSIAYKPGKMRSIYATVTPSGGSGSYTTVLESITANEAIGASDIQYASFGTSPADLSFNLSSNRNTGATPRVYTVTYLVTDATGMSTRTSATVTVPLVGGM